MLNSAECNRQLGAGTASIDITPPVGVTMQGYHLRRATGISDPLRASALAVGKSRVDWLLLTVDVIGLDRGFTSSLRSILSARLGLAPAAIMIACSHTHSGPATLPHLGAVEADAVYLDFLQGRLAAVAELAVDKLQAAHWRFGTSILAENINRRLRRRGEIALETDPNGPVDNRLRVIRIDRAADDRAGTPLALLVHYACHATVSGGVPHISADWPGVMRTALERLYEHDHERPAVFFLQGCTGDVTHRLGRNREAWPEHFGQHTAIQSQILGQLAAAAAINASERSVPLAAESATVILEPLTLPFHERPDAETTELQLVRLGPLPNYSDDFHESAWIIGLPGEPFTNYGTELGHRFRQEFGSEENRVLVSGYTNDCVGYFCTPSALREGGYESVAAHRMYHRCAAFSAATQKLIVNHAATAAKKLVIAPALR